MEAFSRYSNLPGCLWKIARSYESESCVSYSSLVIRGRVDREPRAPVRRRPATDAGVRTYVLRSTMASRGVRTALPVAQYHLYYRFDITI